MKHLFVFIAILFTTSLMSFSSNAYSIENSPYTVIAETGQRLFSRIEKDQESLKKFPDLMRNIVEEELMPSIDYKYAAFKVLGKNLRTMTSDQREKFVVSMRSYLVRTYAIALKQYKDQDVSFESYKPTNGARIVGVNSIISDTNAPEINITFQMRQDRNTSQWKAYDMIIEGISLLSSKEAEISQRIQKSGIDQVTLELASFNH
ncbi:MAG: phospholipid transport system substrate-binding protein [Colwellia sp.]|jgi:phospholipid transport system substrate-binding protein